MADPGVIYTVYGTDGPVADITGNPIQWFLYYRAQGDSGPKSHPVPGILQIDPNSPLGLQVMAWYVASLTDITSVMNGLWNTYTPQITSQVQGQVSHLGFTHVVVRTPDIPDSGRVRAVATSGPGTQFLALDYWVPGLAFPIDCDIDVKLPAGLVYHLSPSLLVTVDVEVLILVPAQEWPSIQFQATSTLHNASIQITNAGTDLQEIAIEVLNAITGLTSTFEGEIDNTILPDPDVSQLTAGIGTLEQEAVSFGLYQCQVSVNPDSKVLSVTLVHPPDGPPFAFNPATYENFSQPTLGLTQYQATPGAQVSVSGSNYPATGEVTVAWYPASSGTVQESYVTWGPEGQQPSTATVQGPASEYTPANLDPGLIYDFQVSNFDGLQITPPSNLVSIQALGLMELVLSYESDAAPPRPVQGGSGQPQPTGNSTPHLATEVIATVPENLGSFSLPVRIPVDALPGPATLCAQYAGQPLACVQLTIVRQVQPQIYSCNPVTGTIGATQLYAGQTMYIRGEGFTPTALVQVFIDQVARSALQTLAAVGADGTFTAAVSWPTAGAQGAASFVTPGNHAIIAKQITLGPIQVSMTVTVEAPLQ
jgi:hypothetical protein